MSRTVFATKIVSKLTGEPKKMPDILGHKKKATIFQINISDKDLLRFADKRAHRSMSRSGLLMAHCFYEALGDLEGEVSKDPYKVGIYCCLDSGPINYETLTEWIDKKNIAGVTIDQTFKRFCPPKQHLKTNVGLVGPHLGMLIKSNGPINTYVNGPVACLQALEQCEIDLDLGIVNLAIVCAGFAADDLMNCIRSSIFEKGNSLAEGAATLVLKKGDGVKCWSKIISKSYGKFGAATPLIEYVSKLEKEFKTENDFKM